MFLPPNQFVSGTLELYNLKYNFAIVSVDKDLNAVCPEDIFNLNPKASKVLAVGRDANRGLIMASLGEVKRGCKSNKLNCKDHMVSTCKINKVCTLVNFASFFVCFTTKAASESEFPV